MKKNVYTTPKVRIKLQIETKFHVLATSWGHILKQMGHMWKNSNKMILIGKRDIRIYKRIILISVVQKGVTHEK